MKTFILIFLLAVLVLGTVSCTLPETLTFPGNEKDIATNTAEKIVDTIQNHNSTALKEMFSVNISNEVSDLDEAAKKLISFMQGDVISYPDTLVNYQFSSRRRDGKLYKEVRGELIIALDEQDYLIFFKECYVAQADKDDIGLKSLYIINADERGKVAELGIVAEWKPGIHIVDLKNMEIDTTESVNDFEESAETE